MNYYVEIVSRDADVVVDRLGPYHIERMAEQAERGVNINLNHGRYYSRIEAKP